MTTQEFTVSLSEARNPVVHFGQRWGCLSVSQYVLDSDFMACSPQRPLPPEARPKTVGTGPPAKPVLVRPTPQSLAPGSVAKSPKIPSKPVAAPILAQDWTASESSEY